MPQLIRSTWDDFIAQHPDAHLLQTSGWGTLKSSFGWEVEWIVNRGMGAQILFRDIPFGFKMAYIPKGPIGIEYCVSSLGNKSSNRDETQIIDENWEQFWHEVDRLCLMKNVAFLKIEPDALMSSSIQRNPPKGFFRSYHSIQPLQTIIIDISPPESQILARMKQKTRYNIRLAQKRGVAIRQSTDLNSFFKLIQLTGRRDQFGTHTLPYYEKAYGIYSPTKECELLIAEYDDQLLAGVMVFAHGKRAWYFYGGSSDHKREYMPSYLAQWEAILWAKAQGCTSYDLWGIPDTNQEDLEKKFQKKSDGLWSVYRFKRGFGGQIVRSVDAWDRVYVYPIWLLYQLWMRWFHPNFG